ncbi:contactin-1a-like [Seriola lalandi dorsalis]|uniref:contactin-1a-like n=1 Tax=Seriola lalandi dorsalis TaxID=1841481 RepID=UPI000C6FAE24|nr:contactin-1a-like [Seriola lalandi dorsalis]
MSLKWFSYCAVTYLSQCVLCLSSAPSEGPVSVDGRALSATEAIVWWLPLLQSNIDGYQVKYWRNQEDSEGGAQRVVVPGKENHTRLEGMRPDSHYLIEVRGYNSAGYGPPSEHLRIHTKKPPPSRPPKIIGKKLKGQSVNIAWEHVEPLANEASIDGYKVLYRQQGHSTGTLYTTSRRYIDLPMPTDGNYVVEVRAHSEGGDGAVARIHITGNRHRPQCELVPFIHVSELFIVQW